MDGMRLQTLYSPPIQGVQQDPEDIVGTPDLIPLLGVMKRVEHQQALLGCRGKKLMVHHTAAETPEMYGTCKPGEILNLLVQRNGTS